MTVVITKAEYDKEVAYARLALIADIQKKLEDEHDKTKDVNLRLGITHAINIIQDEFEKI